eukprot:7822045-Alexandrium_andersonii.AAC.1
MFPNNGAAGFQSEAISGQLRLCHLKSIQDSTLDCRQKHAIDLSSVESGDEVRSSLLAPHANGL